MDHKAQRTAFIAARGFASSTQVKQAAWTSAITSNPAVTGAYGLRKSFDRGVGQVGGWFADRELGKAMGGKDGGTPGGFGSAFSSAAGQYKQRGVMGYLQMFLDMLFNRKQFGQQAALGELSNRAQQNSQWWNPMGYVYNQTLKNRQQAYGAPKGFFAGQS